MNNKTDYNLKGSPLEGLIGATAGFFIGFAAVVALGATAKEFTAILSLSATLGGLLVAMPNLSGSLLRIPFAAWSDSVGARKPMLILLVTAMLGLLGLTLLSFFLVDTGNLTMTYYPILLILGFLAGCGIATFSVGISQTSYWFPKAKQGKALGIYAGLGNTAPGIFSLIMAITLVKWGITGSYLLWFILLSLGTLVYFFIGYDAYSFQIEAQGGNKEEAKTIASEKGQELFPQHNLVDSLKASGKSWKTWSLIGLYFTSFGGFIALATWLPKYWTSFHHTGLINIGVSIKLALLINAIFIIVGSLVRVYSGNLADKISGETTTVIGILVLLAGAIIMTIATSFVLAFTGIMIMSVGMGAMNAAVFKLVPKAVPDAVGGTAGWVGGLGAFGGFVIPPIMGFFVDFYAAQNKGDLGYPLGFSTFIVLALIDLLIIYLFIKKENNS